MSAEVSTGPAVYPLHRCKILHVVRHGQGFHNVAGDLDRDNYMSYDYFDASLTEMGWTQVSSLHKHVRATGISNSVQLVVVSPLTRTLQTATGAFGGDEVATGETGKPLMIEGVGKAYHKAISSQGAPPFVAVEWCREHFGQHPCDKRQPISAYRKLFPAVDFSNIEEEEDVYWQPGGRETEVQLFARAKKFVQWLRTRPETNIAIVSHSGFICRFMRTLADEQNSSDQVLQELIPKLLQRPEKEIAVVSHSSFLFHLMATFGDDCSAVVQDELHSLFANCEMRTVVLADRGAQTVWKSGTTNFAGGIPELQSSPTF